MPSPQPPILPPHQPGRTSIATAALVAVTTCWTTAVLGAAPYAGRSLSEVLSEIGTGELRLVYSSELVPPRLRVLVEPTASAGVALARQLIAPHDLALQHVGGHVYAVVRAPDAPAPLPQSPSDVPLEEIIVASSRYRLADDVAGGRTFLTQAEVEALPRLADDALKVVHRLPGAATNGLSGLAYMRGGAQNETLVVFDGLPLYEPFHLRLLANPTSVLDPRVLDALDIHAGGFSAEFGDRMSAVIDAESMHPAQDRYYELGASLFHSNALAAQRFADGRGQWLVSVRRSNLDEVIDLVEPDLGEPSYVDGFGRLDFAFSDSTHASLHVLHASDRAEVSDDDDVESASADYRNNYAWLTLDHQWSERLEGRLLLSYTDVEASREGTVDDPGRREGFVDDHRSYDVLGVKFDGRYSTPRWLHGFGIEVRSLAARYRYASRIEFAPGFPFPGDPGQSIERSLTPSPSGDHIAAYATSRTRLTDRLTAELGLRWDEQTYGVDADDQLGPRLNLAYEITDQTRLRASWGRYQQAQGIDELQVEDGVDEFQAAQWVDHVIVGIEHDVPGALSLRAEAYRKDYGQLQPRYESLLDPLSLLPELQWDRVRIAPDSTRAQGLELLLSRKTETPWNGWLNYAWSRVRDREDGVDTRRSWDQTQAIGAGIVWTGGPWTATLATTYHTGWPTTSVRHTGTDADGTPEVQIGARNDARLSDYLSIDARLGRHFKLRRGQLDAYVEVTNLSNRRNPCCVDYEFRGTDPAVLVRDEDYWLPLLPSIGVLWRY